MFHIKYGGVDWSLEDSLGRLLVSLGASMPGIMVNGPLQQPWLDKAKAAKDSGLRSGSAH